MSKWEEEQINNPSFTLNEEEIVNPTVPNWLAEISSTDNSILFRIPTALPLKFAEGGMYDSDNGFLHDIDSGGNINTRINDGKYTVTRYGDYRNFYKYSNLGHGKVWFNTTNAIYFELNGDSHRNHRTDSIGVRPSFVIGRGKQGLSNWEEVWLEYEGERDIFHLDRVGLLIKKQAYGLDDILPVFEYKNAVFMRTNGTSVNYEVDAALQASINFNIWNTSVGTGANDYFLNFKGYQSGLYCKVHNEFTGSNDGYFNVEYLGIEAGCNINGSATFSGTPYNLQSFLGVVDWTVSQAPSVIHIDNYTNTTYDVVDATKPGLAPMLPNPYGGEFLSALGTWAVPYEVMDSGNGYAEGLVPAGNVIHGGEYLRKDGTWVDTGWTVSDGSSSSGIGPQDTLTITGTGGTTVTENTQTVTIDSPSYDIMGSGNSYASGLVPAGASMHLGEFLRKDGVFANTAFDVEDGTPGNDFPIGAGSSFNIIGSGGTTVANTPGSNTTTISSPSVQKHFMQWSMKWETDANASNSGTMRRRWFTLDKTYGTNDMYWDSYSTGTNPPTAWYDSQIPGIIIPDTMTLKAYTLYGTITLPIGTASGNMLMEIKKNTSTLTWTGAAQSIPMTTIGSRQTQLWTHQCYTKMGETGLSVSFNAGDMIIPHLARDFLLDNNNSYYIEGVFVLEFERDL